jgi:uncharacterized protein YecT (DUF1311 family)
MNARVITALVLEVILCGSGVSQTPNCKAAKNTYEQQACAHRDLTSAEQELELAFRKAVEAYAPDAAELEEESRMDSFDRAEAVPYRTAMKHQLELSQRAWLSYRKVACATVLTMYENGTAGPTEEFGCRETLTRERTSFLRSYFVQR